MFRISLGQKLRSINEDCYLSVNTRLAVINRKNINKDNSTLEKNIIIVTLVRYIANKFLLEIGTTAVTVGSLEVLPVNTLATKKYKECT